jgi:hypothetical protein
LVLVGLAVVVVVVLWPRTQWISQENFDRITEGMSRAEVEAILGGPPGDYRTVRTVTELCPRSSEIDAEASKADRNRTLAEGEVEADWYGNQGIVRVWFTSGVTAWGRTAVPARGQPAISASEPPDLPFKSFDRTIAFKQDPLDNLLWRAKRQWHRWFP